MSSSEARSDIGSLRVLAHPLRLRLLSLLTTGAMSAAEAARELGGTQANISYHLRRLHSAGLLEISEETSVRGGRARRYRHRPASGETAEARESGDHHALASAVAEELVRRSRTRVPGSRGAFTDAELSLPPDAWARALELADELGTLLHDEARPPGTPGTVRTSATLMLFEMPGEESSP